VARLKQLDAERVVERIWAKDPSVWGGDAATPELADRLGWLDLPERSAKDIATFRRFADEIASEFRYVVLCGMGGSSLAPDVIARASGQRKGRPAFYMLDSTHPDALAAVDGSCEAACTLYVIASKSGSTIETSSFFRHYWAATRGASASFIAITDPGGPLAALAAERRFRRTVESPADVGGRYSALSPFGLVPGALAGADINGLVERGAAMATACRAGAASGNLGAWLGAVLAEAAAAGRDKLTFMDSAELGRFGLWAEQLVAESTGKRGKGVIPVVGEPVGHANVYGSDRLFVRMVQADEPRSEADERMEQLARAGHPTVLITLAGPEDLGGEFFRWEFATAVACAILGVNGFDQPNVAESKRNTAAMLRAGVKRSPVASAGEVRQLVAGAPPGDYVALLAYLPDTPENAARLSGVARRWRDRHGVAVAPAFGPRYLHSTGQLHKGGPEKARFVFVLPTPKRDFPVPGETYSFGTLMAAQAEGDLAALRARGRAAVSVDSLDIVEQAGVL
jgi:glucose-6-phosphate isomerase